MSTRHGQSSKVKCNGSYCHECGSGPFLWKLHSRCLNCEHIWCQECTQVYIRPERPRATQQRGNLKSQRKPATLVELMIDIFICTDQPWAGKHLLREPSFGLHHSFPQQQLRITRMTLTLSVHTYQSRQTHFLMASPFCLLVTKLHGEATYRCGPAVTVEAVEL